MGVGSNPTSDNFKFRNLHVVVMTMAEWPKVLDFRHFVMTGAPSYLGAGSNPTFGIVIEHT